MGHEFLELQTLLGYEFLNFFRVFDLLIEFVYIFHKIRARTIVKPWLLRNEFVYGVAIVAKFLDRAIDKPIIDATAPIHSLFHGTDPEIRVWTCIWRVNETRLVKVIGYRCDVRALPLEQHVVMATARTWRAGNR